MVPSCTEAVRDVYLAFVDRGVEEGGILSVEKEAFYDEIERGLYDSDPEFFVSNLEIVFHGMGAMFDLLKNGEPGGGEV